MEHAPLEECSSSISGEGVADSEKEVVVISEAVGHALDDFNLVVDAFDEAGPDGVCAVGQNAGDIGLQVPCELLECRDSAVDGAPIPLAPESLSSSFGSI